MALTVEFRDAQDQRQRRAFCPQEKLGKCHLSDDHQLSGGHLLKVKVAPNTGRVVAVLALSALLLTPAHLTAQFAVVDATNYAENVLQYARMLAQLRAAQSQIANQVTALRKLANPRFRDVGTAWSSVNATMAGGSGVVYGEPAAVGTLQGTFPGEVANRQYVPERTAQVAKTLATAAAVLKAAQAQGTTYSAGRQQLDAMKSQVGTIQGHEQALELQNTIGVFHANEAMLTRQAVEGQANLQAVYYAQQVNDQAQAEANARVLYASMGTSANVHRALLSFRPAA
jgi:type IV secretion system protein TrbJ